MPGSGCVEKPSRSRELRVISRPQWMELLGLPSVTITEFSFFSTSTTTVVADADHISHVDGLKAPVSAGGQRTKGRITTDEGKALTAVTAGAAPGRRKSYRSSNAFPLW